MPRRDQAVDRRMTAVLVEAERFFMGSSNVHRAVDRLVALFDRLGVDYAVAGALAVGFHGRPRMTEDIDVLITREGLERFRAEALGHGYLEKFPGSRGVRDVENRVDVDFLVAGEYPGDGRPKPVRFPDPSLVMVRGDRFRTLDLRTLVELKLASGMTAPDRLIDLGDVISLVRACSLPEAFADQLDPYVREKYLELWRAAQRPAEP